MNRFFFLLVAAAFAIAPAAYAQIDFCFIVDQNGYTVEGTMYNDTDVAIATGNWGSTTLATAVRGTVSSEIRHHAFTFINPNPSADPGCLGQDFLVDWLTYNGRITGGNATNGYNWTGTFENSCEFVPGSRTGVIYIGGCPVSRPALIDNGDARASAPEEELGAASVAAPEGFALSSAPNPFERGTVISFAIPDASDVRLVVYDVLGREVAVLIDEYREAGEHSVVFESASLPSGTYLYRIEAGGQAEAKQMLLVR